MKNIVLIVLLCSFFSLFAEESAQISKIATLNLVVDDIKIADVSVNDIINSYNLTIDNMNNNSQSKINRYTFLTKEDQFNTILKELTKTGDVTLNQIKTINNYFNLQSNNYDLEYLNSQKQSYKQELARPLIKENTEYYYSLWESERDFDEKIYQSNLSRINLLNEIEYYRIELEVSEKTAQYFDEEDEFIDFVNMPGIESSLFIVENPDENVSAGSYMGASLRYMFTKGKTFFTLGILKPYADYNDNVTTQANDIFTYGLGKDFYPRYLGQGRRTWFNPYSGFLVGGMIITSDDEIYHMFTAEPHIGIEVFKNQYVIFDTRIGYTIPLDKEKIKIMRGFTQNITFNIVF